MLTPLQQALALQLLPNSGSGVHWKLCDVFGSLGHAFAQDYATLSKFFNEAALRELSLLEKQGATSHLYSLIDQEQNTAWQNDIALLTHSDENYPALLKEISRPPALLYVKGSSASLSLPQIAIVGSRRPTPIGRDLAFDFGRQLCEKGFTITSGLALGIDGLSHEGALSARAEGKGSTIAVLGSGLMKLYPKRHVGLAHKICEQGGALVSEFPLDTDALRQNFPQRNRIVSGLACGTLVVEAALKSGSLITARLALEQNREVFAIPGSIRSDVSRGCHAMIKSGAKLVETAADIINELGGMLGFYQQQLVAPERTNLGTESLLNEEKALFALIGFEETPLDQLAARAKQPTSELASVLLQLELKGVIENTGLGYIRV